MIKIGYFGDGPWAHKAFEKLISDETISIEFITVRFNAPDSTLIDLAEKYSIPVELTPNINSDEFLQRISKYSVDIFVSMSFNQIFKAKTINFPPLKTINCHAGKLPFYRGRNILNWVLINDEKEFGVTVHYVDEGIDTGDIILQRTLPITDDDDYGTLLSRAYIECADALYISIKYVQAEAVTRIKQDTIDSIGLYCGARVAGDEIINWNQSSREIFNFVRAVAKPGPMATSNLNGKEIKINRVREIIGARSYINKPGQILGKTKNGGFYAKTKDTFVEIIEYEYEGKIKVGNRMV